MAARTSKNKEALNPKANNETMETAIHIPDDILQHIFSFLPTKSLAQTILLSKHWNHLSLWRTHPHLHFSSLPPPPPNPHLPLIRPPHRPATFLPLELLSRRQQDSDVKSFRFFGRASNSSLRDSIDQVTKYGIELIELDVDLESSFNLPPSLFNCETLEVLILNGRMPYRYFYCLAGLPSVHTLSLTRVDFGLYSGLFKGHNFPLLRKLCLKDCEAMRDLNINCPGLEILNLDGFSSIKSWDISCIGLLELQVKRCSVSMDSVAKIFAPSLRRLYWGRSDIYRVDCMTDSFQYLNTGQIYLLLDRWKPPNPVLLQRAATFISAFCFVQSLSVGRRVLKILSQIDSDSGLQCSFKNLVTLKLHSELTKDEVAGIIWFLRSSPILQSITIFISHSKICKESCNDEKNWRSQSQNLKSFEHHLKIAKIDVRGNKMSKRAVYLVNFLLRHETMLQEMTLTLKSDPADSPLVRQRILSELMRFRRLYSNVKISFLPQDQSPTAEEP